MTTAQSIYLFALVVGMGYVLIVALMGQMGGDAGGHGGGAGHIDVGHGDTGHGGVGDGADSGATGLHFAPFSPLVIASFAGAFGAVGLIASGFTKWSIIHVPVAIGGGLGIGFMIAWLMAKLNQMSAAETSITGANLIGCEAIVSVMIPSTGTGEITYEVQGSRFNAPAQSEGKQEIAKGNMVAITRIVGNTFFVKPSTNEKLRSIKEGEE